MKYLRPKSRAARPGGFTLIEILVVLVIVGILAAILFPVFGQARANARAASCASNLKQIGLAALQYAQDHNGLLPLTAVSLDKQRPRCGWPDYFFRYARDTQVFQCPDDEEERAYNPACTATPEAPVREGAGGYSFVGIYNNLKRIEPTVLILALDGRGNAIGAGDHPSPQIIENSYGEPRHLGTYAIVFGDGHVKRLTADKMLDVRMWGYIR